MMTKSKPPLVLSERAWELRAALKKKKINIRDLHLAAYAFDADAVVVLERQVPETPADHSEWVRGLMPHGGHIAMVRVAATAITCLERHLHPASTSAFPFFCRTLLTQIALGFQLLVRYHEKPDPWRMIGCYEKHAQKMAEHAADIPEASEFVSRVFSILIHAFCVINAPDMAGEKAAQALASVRIIVPPPLYDEHLLRLRLDLVRWALKGADDIASKR